MDVSASIEKEFPNLDSFARKSFLAPRDVYQDFLDIVVAELGSEIGYLHHFDALSEEIELAVFSKGVFAICSTTHTSHYPLRMAGIWADCVREKRTVIHNDYQAAASEAGLPEGHFPIERHMSAPAWGKKGIEAIIGVGNRAVAYDREDSKRLERIIKLGWPIVADRLTDYDAHMADREKVFDESDPEEILTGMLKAIGRSLELRDEYTSRHQSNVAYICDKIAEEMNLPHRQRVGLRIGALIHDIGKIGIPSQILSKPGKLYPAEFELLKMHATLGADIFRDLNLPWPVADIVEQHHERLDGTGYPHGLIGDSILLEARIVAVADTFDALASDRPYRKTLGRARAVEVLKNGRGKAFDPYVVDAFFAILESDPILMPGGRYK